MNTTDIDQTALRLTEMAAVSVRALEERKPGCAEKNNIGLVGAIRHALIAEREHWEAEIERLRAALERIIVLRMISSFQNPQFDTAADVARTALGHQQSLSESK